MTDGQAKCLEDLFMTQKRLEIVEGHRDNYIEMTNNMVAFIKEKGLTNEYMAWRVAQRMEES